MDTDETPPEETMGKHPEESGNTPENAETPVKGEARELYLCGGYSQSQIADRLGIPVGTLKGWIARGQWASMAKGNEGTGEQGCRDAGLMQETCNSKKLATRDETPRATPAPPDDPADAAIARAMLAGIKKAKVPEIKTIRELQIAQAIYHKATGRDKAGGGNGRGVNIMILQGVSAPDRLPAGKVTEAELLPD